MPTTLIIRPSKCAARIFNATWSCELRPDYTDIRFDDGRHFRIETATVYNGSIRWHWLFWRALTIHTPDGRHTFVGLTPRAAQKLTKTLKALLIERFDKLKASVTALHDEYTQLLQGDFYIRSHIANRFVSDNRLAFDNANACQKLLTDARFINSDVAFSTAAKTLVDFSQDPMQSLRERNEAFVRTELSLPRWQKIGRASCRESVCQYV